MRHQEIKCPGCNSFSVGPYLYALEDIYECFGCGEIFESDDFDLRDRRVRYDRKQEQVMAQL